MAKLSTYSNIFAFLSMSFGLSYFEQNSLRGTKWLRFGYFSLLVLQIVLGILTCASFLYHLVHTFTVHGFLGHLLMTFNVLVGIVTSFFLYWHQKEISEAYLSIRSSMLWEDLVKCDHLLLKDFIINAVIFLILMGVNIGCLVVMVLHLPKTVRERYYMKFDFLKERPELLISVFAIDLWLTYAYQMLLCFTLTTFCANLTTCCKQFNRRLQFVIRHQPKTFDERVWSFRRQFTQMSSNVNRVNDIFKYFLSLWISFFMVTICARLRFLKPDSASFNNTVPLIGQSTLILTFIHMFRVIYKEANVLSFEARKSAEYIMDYISECNYKSTTHFHLLMFSQRVNQSNIGISVGNFAIINTNFLLTIFGTILTYSIILFQSS